MNSWKIFGLGVATAVLAVVSFWLGYETAKRAVGTHEIIKVEQVSIRDTIIREKPIFVANRVLLHDTIPIILKDTIYKTDTIWLPREQKVYEDSTYRAVISGIEPRLDTIAVYRQTIYQTKFVTQKEWRRFTYGLQGGVGAVMPFNGKPTIGGYVGIGIGINF